jgi:hypothetical protein
MQTIRILRISQLALGLLLFIFVAILWYIQHPENMVSLNEKIANSPVNNNQLKQQIEDQLNTLSKSWSNQTIESSLLQLEKIQTESEELLQHLKQKKSIENETHFSQLRSTLSKLENSTQPSSLISSVQLNMNQYMQFVKAEKYPRLIKISQQLINLNQKMDADNENLLQRQSNESLRMIEEMGAIVRKSSLNQQQRQAVQAKLDAISTEIEMLKQIAQNNVSVKREMDKYQQTLLAQFKNTPTLQPSQIQSSDKNLTNKNLFVLACLAMSLLTVGIMWLTHFLQKRLLQENQNYTESSILEQLERVSAQRELTLTADYVSPRFISQFQSHNDYINRRMSYGSLFQNSLPYPSVCLNSQLKVNWCNSSFISEFGIEDYRNQLENLSWDYLRKLTNINDCEPVLQAMQNERDEVLDIRVKKPNASKSRPFLMHVRPANYHKEKYIMLYFMPMDFVENSIEKQSKAVMQPILETFKMLNEERDDLEQWNNIKEAFQKSNAGNIYQKIEEYRSHISQRLNQMQLDLQNIKNANTNFKQQENLYRLKFTQVESYLEKGSNAFRQIKSDFVSFAEIIARQTDQMHEVSQRYAEISKYAQEKDRYLVQWNSNLAKIEQSINTILDSQSIKKSLDEVVGQLKHAIKHSQSIEEIIPSIESMQTSLSRQEVHLTKIKMLLNEVDRKNMPAISNPGFEVSAKSFNELIEKFEDSLVINLQDAFINLQATKQELKLADQAQTFIN